jgi:hypothetical protein
MMLARLTAYKKKFNY